MHFLVDKLYESRYNIIRDFGEVAQLARHAVHTRRVGGSNPSFAIFYIKTYISDYIGLLAKLNLSNNIFYFLNKY